MRGITPCRVANAIFSELCISEGEVEQHYKIALEFYDRFTVDERPAEIEKAV